MFGVEAVDLRTHVIAGYSDKKPTGKELTEEQKQSYRKKVAMSLTTSSGNALNVKTHAGKLNCNSVLGKGTELMIAISA